MGQSYYTFTLVLVYYSAQLKITFNKLYNMFNVVEFDDYAEIVDDDPDYAHPMAGGLINLV